MKKPLPVFILFFFLLIQSVYAQKLSIQKVNNTNLSYVLNNIRSTHTTETAGYVVTVYVVSNKNSSATQPETHEVTDNIYIAVSDFDEQPRQSLLEIKNVYAPTGLQLIKQNEQHIQLSFIHTVKGSKKKFQATIQSDGQAKVE